MVFLLHDLAFFYPKAVDNAEGRSTTGKSDVGARADPTPFDEAAEHLYLPQVRQQGIQEGEDVGLADDGNFCTAVGVERGTERGAVCPRNG